MEYRFSVSVKVGISHRKEGPPSFWEEEEFGLLGLARPPTAPLSTPRCPLCSSAPLGLPLLPLRPVPRHACAHRLACRRPAVWPWAGWILCVSASALQEDSDACEVFGQGVCFRVPSTGSRALGTILDRLLAAVPELSWQVLQDALWPWPGKGLVSDSTGSRDLVGGQNPKPSASKLRSTGALLSIPGAPGRVGSYCLQPDRWSWCH